MTRPQLPKGYGAVLRVPTLAEYMRLRAVSGLSAHEEAAARQGLEGTIFAVVIESEGRAIGMGRITGDGGCFFQLNDIAVDPAHQGKGLGKVIMAALMDHVNTALPPTAFVSLLADVPADVLYAQFGFRHTAPASVGMSYRPMDRVSRGGDQS